MAREMTGDRAVIGREISARRARARARPQTGIAGDRDAVAFGWDRTGSVGPAIAIDDEPRIAAQHRRRVEHRREAARHRGGADIPPICS